MKALAFLTFLLVAAGSVHAEDQGFVVHKQTVQDRKAVVATIESTREVQARARLNGTLSLLAVKEGDHVTAGEKIAVIGDAKLAIKGQGSEARIQGATSAFDKARIDLSRAQELRQSGYGTQAKLDEARANYQIAEQNLQAVKSEKQEIIQQTAEGVVLAPNSGRILKVPVSIGSVVMPGETIAVLTQENYILRLELPESHARFMKVGDTVEIGARGLQPSGVQALRTGTVRLIYPEIKNGRITADVEANELGDYFVGERTRVYVNAGERETYLVPSELIKRLSGIDRVRLKDGQEVAVQVGRVWGDKTEVLSGLHEGDVLVTP